MKKKVSTLTAAGLFSLLMVSGGQEAQAVKLKDADIDFGIQYRVMYNSSNIASKNSYDFFRQRLRFNFDVKSESGVGGFVQLEYRGGWGGASPGLSDPRGAYSVNAFNRLQARGVRYGYLYFPAGPGTVLAGILPANDEVDQMLFSADWDLNIGGIAYAGKVGEIGFRTAYVALVDGAFYRDQLAGDKDQHFLVLDLNSKFGNIDAGIHYYGTYGKVCLPSNPNYPINCGPADFVTLNQTWIGPTATVKLDPVSIHGVLLYNTGKIDVNSTDGWLARLEGSTKLGPVSLGLLGIYSSGKSNGTGFQTVHGILGTGGYWAYTYIFTPHGPSDVNDYGLEPGNKGYGLTTLQAKVDVPVTNNVSVQGIVGWFRSNKDIVLPGPVNVGKNIGVESGVTINTAVGKNMNLEFGGAIAGLGTAGKSIYQGNTKGSIHEIFARLQLEF